MTSKHLKNIRIVLSKTSHPGNIGSAARAMKTMGLSQLYLHQPRIFPHAKASELAAGADDILIQAIEVKSLSQALDGCHIVFGTSNRARELSLPVLDPAQSSQKINEMIAANLQVAVIFGCEQSGLSNEALMQCHYQVTIPTQADYQSLNLAAAVQVMSYEIYKTCLSQQKHADKESEHKGSHQLASADDVNGFYQHLEAVLQDVQFLNPNNPKRLVPRLRRLFNRIQLEKMEVNILRGIINAIQKRLNITKGSG